MAAAAPVEPKSSPQLAAELGAIYPGLRVQKHDNHVLSLHTKIRDKTCSRNDFVFNANRLMRLLVEEALATVEYQEKIVTTPTGLSFKGVEIAENVVGVSILRAGESMEQVLGSAEIASPSLHTLLPDWH